MGSASARSAAAPQAPVSPTTAITASSMNFSSVPPWSLTSRRAWAKMGEVAAHQDAHVFGVKRFAEGR